MLIPYLLSTCFNYNFTKTEFTCLNNVKTYYECLNCLNRILEYFQASLKHTYVAHVYLKRKIFFSCIRKY